MCELVLNFIKEEEGFKFIKESVKFCATITTAMIFRMCKKGDLDGVKRYVRFGGDINVKNSKGFSLLHVASYYYRSWIVNYLLCEGFDVNTLSKCGKTALHSVLSKEKRSKLVLEHNTTKWGSDYTSHLKSRTIECLVHYGVNINKRDNFGVTALHTLCFVIDRDTHTHLSYLLENGADINVRDNNGATLLHYFCKNARYCGVNVTLDLFLKNGADVNVVDNNGSTALHYAATNSYFEKVFSYFHERIGFLHDRTDVCGNTPIHVICMHHDYDTICKTIDISQVNFHTKNKNGSIAFDFLYKKGDSDSYKLYSK